MKHWWLYIVFIFPCFPGMAQSDSYLENAMARMNEQAEEQLARGEVKEAYNTRKKAVVMLSGRKGIPAVISTNQLHSLADLAFDLGNYVMAGRIYGELEDIILETKGRSNLSFANINSKNAAYQRSLGFLEYAEGLVTESYNLATEFGLNTPEGIEITLELARIFLAEGKYAQAENYFRQAQKLAMELGTNELLSELLIDYAILELKLNNPLKSEKLLDEAFNSIEKQNNRKRMGVDRYHVALLEWYIETGNIRKSDSLAGNLIDLEDVFFPSSLVTFDLKELKIRLEIQKENFEVADSLTKALVSDFRQQIGQNHYKMGRYIHLQSLIHYRNGNYDKAIEYARQSKNLRNKLLPYEHPENLESISLLSQLYWANGEIKKARKYFLKSLYFYKRQFQSNFAFLSEQEKALFYSQIKNYFDIFNSFVLQNGESDPSLYIEMFNNQLMSKGLLFNTTRNMRAKVEGNEQLESIYSNWLMSRERLNKVRKVDDPVILEQLGLNVDSLVEAANVFEKELSLRVNLGESQSDQEDIYKDWTAIRYQLKRREGALEMIRIPYFDPANGGQFEEEKVAYCALLVTKKTRRNPIPIVIENGWDLETRFINYYRNSVIYQLTDTLSYAQFGKPFFSNRLVNDLDKLYLSPDGVYNQLNLNTLYNYSSGSYVADEQNLVIIGNLKDLEDQPKKERKEGSFMLMGFPEYNFSPLKENNEKEINIELGNTRALGSKQKQLSRLFGGNTDIPVLPGTYEEIMSINKLLNEHDRDARVYLGKDASESSIKNVNDWGMSPTIVHIATHGFFLAPSENESASMSQVDPLSLSGLLLTGASFGYDPAVTLYELDQMKQGNDFQDGILTAYEAMNLELNETDLVILSACETGLGVIKSGEGVYGLQRSLQTSGAASVIMSLWKVDDEATNQFMQLFYRNYLTLGDKREAFKRAQSELREKYSHPYFWGAFVLIGT